MKNARYLSISIAVLILDQVTKYAIVHGPVAERTIVIVPNFVRLAYGENSGALFGLFSSAPQPWRTIVLLLVPALAIVLVVIFMRSSGEKDRLILVALALILGGALGNQADRLLRGGKVVDFIDVSIDLEPVRGWLESLFGTSHWPAFNVADTAIVTGACLLAFDLLRRDAAALMHPILIDLGWRDLPLLGSTHIYLGTYGVLFALGALVGWLFWLRQAQRDGLDLDRLLDLGFYALLAGLLGSKIGLILTDPGYYLGSLSALASTLRAAGVLAFGVIAAIATIAFYTWRHGLSFWAVADSMAPSLAIGQAIGRLGCLMAGCCYGKPSPGLPWGIRFTDPAAAVLSGTPLYDPNDPEGALNVLHPTQLYQAGADFLLFLLLAFGVQKRAFTGQRALLYIGLYSLTRGTIEFFRGDLERGVFDVFGTGLHLSTSQLISLGGLVFVVVAWPLLSRRHRPAK